MEKSDFFSLIKQMDFALLLTSSKQEEECFNRIIETAVSITDSEAGHLLLLDNSGEYLELKAYKSLNNEKVENFKVPIGKGITGNVFISGQALNIADVSKNKEMYKSVSSALHDTEDTIHIQIDDIAIVPIKIKDNGKGMDKKEIKNIFRPFFTSKINSSSWGLGLYFTHIIVKKHYGYIKINSKVGNGSEFYIMLPKYVQ